MTAPAAISVENAGKLFRIYSQRKTLFDLTAAVMNGVPIKRELWAVRNLSFTIRQGEKVGLIGLNGAGKSTLLRLLSGIYRPTEGKITTANPVRPLFRYGLGIIPSLPVFDNIFILGAFYGLSVEKVREKMADILDFSELTEFVHVPAKDLSAGMYQRLAFSVFIQTGDPCLAFDESTGMADLSFRTKVGRFFKSFMESERTIVIATHDLIFLKQYCPRTLWIDHGRLKMDGATEEVTKAYTDFCGGSRTGEEPAEPNAL